MEVVMVEKLNKKIEELKNQYQELVKQKETIQSNIEATFGAIQMCEILIKEETQEDKCEKSKGKD